MAMPLRSLPELFSALQNAADGDLADPMVSARALARVVMDRRARGDEPLTFGMTFPYSTHNYQLRFWMAAGGVDPDQDVRLIVLPPPTSVESLANKHVDAFLCRYAVEFGRGRSRHRTHPAFRVEILERAAEKVLAVRARWVETIRRSSRKLVRAHGRAATFVEHENNRDEVARILSAPERIAVASEVIRRTLDGRLKISPDGAYRSAIAI